MRVLFMASGVLLLAGLLSSCAGGSTESGSSGKAKANVFLVASKSFCVATGIDDAYTGDGHVEFFLTFRNSGTKDGSFNAIPVRHYDDGSDNESALDEVSADVAAGTVQRFHTDEMK